MYGGPGCGARTPPRRPRTVTTFLLHLLSRHGVPDAVSHPGQLARVQVTERHDPGFVRLNNQTSPARTDENTHGNCIINCVLCKGTGHWYGVMAERNVAVVNSRGESGLHVLFSIAESLEKEPSYFSS